MEIWLYKRSASTAAILSLVFYLIDIFLSVVLTVKIGSL